MKKKRNLKNLVGEKEINELMLPHYRAYDGYKIRRRFVEPATWGQITQTTTPKPFNRNYSSLLHSIKFDYKDEAENEKN